MCNRDTAAQPSHLEFEVGRENRICNDGGDSSEDDVDGVGGSL